VRMRAGRDHTRGGSVCHRRVSWQTGTLRSYRPLSRAQSLRERCNQIYLRRSNPTASGWFRIFSSAPTPCVWPIGCWLGIEATTETTSSGSCVVETQVGTLAVPATRSLLDWQALRVSRGPKRVEVIAESLRNSPAAAGGEGRISGRAIAITEQGVLLSSPERGVQGVQGFSRPFVKHLKWILNGAGQRNRCLTSPRRPT